MRILPMLLAGAMLGCVASHAPAPSAGTAGPSGLLYVVLALDKLK